MTTFGKNAKNTGIRTQLDELDVLINASVVSGDTKGAKELAELRNELSEFFEDLSEIFDTGAEKRLEKTLGEEVRKFLKKDE